MAAMRYLVSDVDAAVAFYTGPLGFALEERWGSAVAIVSRGDLTLWLSGPRSSAAQAMPDGRRPEPGGWNRFVVEVPDLDGMVEKLRGVGVAFRGAIVSGPGGRQVVIEDPAGNPVELFELAAGRP